MTNDRRDKVLRALSTIREPGSRGDIVAMNQIRDLAIDGPRLTFRLVASSPGPGGEKLVQAAREAALSVEGIESVEVKLEVAAPRAGALQEPQAIPGIRNIIAVSSGKGGVGKSTVAVNLAVALAQEGAAVGLLDSDVYGPNVPIMVGVKEEPKVQEQVLVPHEAHGIRVMSIGFLNPGDRPVVWRGPMLHKIVQQFLYGVNWGQLDYLIVDMPPGTGDVQLSLAQLVPVNGAVIVTTPQEVAMADVRKAINMFEQVQIPILGIVENMSYYVCPNCSERHHIFGSGGGEELAKRFSTVMLGQVPLATTLREAGDAGTPILVSAPASEQAEAFREIARGVSRQLAGRKDRGLPVINIS
jgi:ATP-binding protein involved in chromosome partitioning